ncbi:MAG: hypothetical protein H0X38_08075 [Planctomycetes bacterium]|nr:hypothetical protein [Planctomycetota bacterium]
MLIVRSPATGAPAVPFIGRTLEQRQAAGEDNALPAGSPPDRVAGGRDGGSTPSGDRTDASRTGKDDRQDGKDSATIGAHDDQPDDATARIDTQLIAQLARRDRDVRAHEAAHQAAGGNLVGAARLDYQVGPDGHAYAVGGEVSVDVSAVSGDPAATIVRMERVRAAALAPADPSSQDLAVASAAAAIAADAQRQLAELQRQTAVVAKVLGSYQPSAATVRTGTLLDRSA